MAKVRGSLDGRALDLAANAAQKEAAAKRYIECVLYRMCSL